ncbi:MAG: TetR/AcrR family transcriptional regulator [Spirochaetales bacterium]|nr:TetR/AcrR family transcriptional regulator [Spirochaetales bacterium]
MGTVATSARDSIEASAIRLFSERWYSSVSVAEICRDAGVSNGIFYKYYDNKENLIRTILDDVIAAIALALEGVDGPDPAARLSSMASILVGFAAEHRDLIIVFREGQYRYFEYERRLVDLYRAVLGKALGRPVTMADYLFALGGIRFAGVRSALHGTPLSLPALGHMLAQGIFPGLAWDSKAVFGIAATPSPVALAESARERMIHAGKRLFGENDYHAVNIYQITEAAGLAVGSFYRHFKSKDEFFRALIDEAGHEIRRFISTNLRPGLNRLERELQGMYLFAAFLSMDRWCYNIVREGEFVAPDRVRAYYGAFENGYRKQGTDGMDARRAESDPLWEDTAIQFMLGISHYFGIELLFEGLGRGARGVIEGVAKLLSRGLAGADGKAD